jgi:translation initiation factor 1A
MRNRVWISRGDIVLCGLRDFQDDKVDIIHKYNSDEIHQLQNLCEIPKNIATTTSTTSTDIKDINGQDDGEDIDFTTI